jgi:biotin carboxylase
MKKKVLIVASKLGYQTRVFAEAAERLGIEPVMATDRCKSLDDPWGDHAIPLRMEDAGESVKRLRQHAEQTAGLAGIVAVGDRPAVIAAHLARDLGLKYHPPEAAEAAQNKYKSRERFRAAGLPVPSYFRVGTKFGLEAGLARAPWPCVLKPLDLSGSRGVIRANNPDEFRAAFERIRAIIDLPEFFRLKGPEHHSIQVEEYIDGREYALEGLVTGGKLRTLALFDKPDPLDGPFFEETIYVTPSRAAPESQKAMKTAVQRAVKALGLTDGPIHAELRMRGAEPYVLEVAGRPIGGLCARTLRFNRGIPLEEVILRHALGEPLARLRLDGNASGVMMIPIPRNGVYEGVDGVEAASLVRDIEGVEITAKEGQTLLKLPEGASYLGFLFARAKTPEAAEKALRASHEKLIVRMATALPVLRTAARRA